MSDRQNKKHLLRTSDLLPRWSVALLLLGFLLGSFLPTLNWKVRAAPRQASALDVVINEVAWMGTGADANDEWIELYNPGSTDIDLSGWRLTDNGDIDKVLNGIIPANGYYLLERTDDDPIDLPADEYYTGGLNNTVEILELWDSSSTPVLIDTANKDGTNWNAGDNTTKASMERVAVIADSSTAWASNNGITVNGLDAGNNPLRATPKQANSVGYIPLSIIINEVAWAGTEAYFGDEWIELYNPSAYPISLDGWRLASDSGNVDIFLSGTLANGAYLLLERGSDGNATNIIGQTYDSGLLEDSGDTLRLLAPDRTEIDTANGDGGAWSHGRISPASSMERMSTASDSDTNWVTNINQHATTKDAAGNFIYGTPGEENWGYSVTPTTVPSPTQTSTPPASLALLINEVAWGGTEASTSDEWMELYNSGSYPINLSAGWKLVSSDGGLDISLSGTIDVGSNGYFLLERTDDTTISDIIADQIYTGSLSNDGEYLKLLAPDGKVVDTANKNGGDWDAGSASPGFYSMERSGVVEDSGAAWISNTGIVRIGHDNEGNPINGTPRQPNWSLSVTATPSPTPTRTPIPPTSTPTSFPNQSVVLNEVLARPGHDWNQDGVVDVNDEFIEIINRGTSAVSLSGWKLDDEYSLGSSPYTLPNITLPAGDRIAIYGFTSHISLSDGGDTVRLLNSGGAITDVITYTVIKGADQSWCRYPENGFWNSGCFPTPNEENTLLGVFPPQNEDAVRASCLVPDTVPEEILLIECGLLGMSVRDGEFWEAGLPAYWLTGHSKYSTWFR